MRSCFALSYFCCSVVSQNEVARLMSNLMKVKKTHKLKLGHFSANIFIIKLGRMFGTIINVTRNVWWLAGLPAMNVEQGCHIVIVD